MADIYRLESVNKQIIWGGSKLSSEYGKGSDGEKIAEAWELTVHPEGINAIIGGEKDGMPLSDITGDDFPIMIKLIDAADRLSVQVHPVKTEMWYILDCEENASLVYGLKNGFDREDFEKHVDNGTVEELLRFVPVHKGDVFFIPQGLVHAIGAGITVAEIQQNSNITYRIYDYNRLQNGKPRQLHTKEAVEVIKDFTDAQIEALRYENGCGGSGCIADCSLFRVDILSVNGNAEIGETSTFSSVICLEGNGKINGMNASRGDSFYIPENCGIILDGQMKILLTRPNTPAGSNKTPNRQHF